MKNQSNISITKKALILFMLITALISCNDKDVSNSTAVNIEITNQYFENFNNHNWGKVAEMYAETVECKDPSFGNKIVRQAKEQIFQRISEMEKSYP